MIHLISGEGEVIERLPATAGVICRERAQMSGLDAFVEERGFKKSDHVRYTDAQVLLKKRRAKEERRERRMEDKRLEDEAKAAGEKTPPRIRVLPRLVLLSDDEDEPLVDDDDGTHDGVGSASVLFVPEEDVEQECPESVPQSPVNSD